MYYHTLLGFGVPSKDQDLVPFNVKQYEFLKPVLVLNNSICILGNIEVD